ncbi:MAG: sigma-E factor negative regulatory protein RseC [Oceanospirillaceae bacterium]|jgi:sigma-E factor negative regulatory protein RseC
MIEEKALIVAVSENEVTIAATRNSACGQCASKSDCGQSSIAQWAASKMVNIEVRRPIDLALEVGDTVLVGINEKSFLKASLLLYFFPLVGMFVAAAVATSVSALEWQVIVSAFVGLFCSFYLVRFISKKLEQRSIYQMLILDVVK